MLEYRLVAETGVEQPRAAGEAAARTSVVEIDEQLALSPPAAFDPWSEFA
jgi:hypothetical protein